MNRTTFALASAALVVALSACQPQEEVTVEKADPARTVRTSRVATGDAVTVLEAVGDLQGEKEVSVYAPMPERIQSLRVVNGQAVKKGQILAILDNDLQSEAMRQAEAGLTAAEAARDALEDEVRRTRALVEAGGAPRAQLESLEAQLRTQSAQVNQIAAGVSSAAAQRRRAILTAPVDGVVSDLILREGDMASPSMPLLTVVEPDRLLAVFQVPERDFLRLAKGMKARVSPLGNDGLVREAEVSFVSLTVDRRSRTGRVEVKLDNADRALVPGSAVKGTFELERRSGVVLVPAKAILLTAETERTGRAIAFVAEGDKATRRDIVVGERQGGDIEVTAGLKPGEELVTSGQHLLRDGSPIRRSGEGAAQPTAAAPAQDAQKTASSEDSAAAKEALQ